METKDIISNSLIQISKDKQIYNITIRDIAKQSGVSIGTIYNNFKDKNEIINYTYVSIKKDFKSYLENNYNEANHFESLIRESISYSFENKDKIKFITNIDVINSIDLKIKNTLGKEWNEFTKMNMCTNKPQEMNLIIFGTLQNYIFNYENRNRELEESLIKNFQLINNN